MMLAYHVFFDLDYFGMAAVRLDGLPLVLLQRVTGALFLLVAGISLTLSEARNREGCWHHAKRALALAGVAALITLATWVYPHEGFIKFGIIHMLAVSTLIAPFFFGLGRLNVLLGIAIIATGIPLGHMQADTPWLFWLGITYPGYSALDHYAMLPWFGVILIGIYTGQTLFPGGWSPFRFARCAALDSLALMGRNSLLIYVAHQPLIIGTMLALKAAAGA